MAVAGTHQPATGLATGYRRGGAVKRPKAPRPKKLQLPKPPQQPQQDPNQDPAALAPPAPPQGVGPSVGGGVPMGQPPDDQDQDTVPPPTGYQQGGEVDDDQPSLTSRLVQELSRLVNKPGPVPVEGPVSTIGVRGAKGGLVSRRGIGYQDGGFVNQTYTTDPAGNVAPGGDLVNTMDPAAVDAAERRAYADAGVPIPRDRVAALSRNYPIDPTASNAWQSQYGGGRPQTGYSDPNTVPPLGQMVVSNMENPESDYFVGKQTMPARQEAAAAARKYADEDAAAGGAGGGGEGGGAGGGSKDPYSEFIDPETAKESGIGPSGGGGGGQQQGGGGQQKQQCPEGCIPDPNYKGGGGQQSASAGGGPQWASAHGGFTANPYAPPFPNAGQDTGGVDLATPIHFRRGGMVSPHRARHAAAIKSVLDYTRQKFGLMPRPRPRVGYQEGGAVAAPAAPAPAAGGDTCATGANLPWCDNYYGPGNPTYDLWNPTDKRKSTLDTGAAGGTPMPGPAQQSGPSGIQSAYGGMGSDPIGEQQAEAQATQLAYNQPANYDPFKFNAQSGGFVGRNRIERPKTGYCGGGMVQQFQGGGPVTDDDQPTEADYYPDVQYAQAPPQQAPPDQAPDQRSVARRVLDWAERQAGKMPAADVSGGMPVRTGEEAPSPSALQVNPVAGVSGFGSASEQPVFIGTPTLDQLHAYHTQGAASPDEVQAAQADADQGQGQNATNHAAVLNAVYGGDMDKASRLLQAFHRSGDSFNGMARAALDVGDDDAAVRLQQLSHAQIPDGQLLSINHDPSDPDKFTAYVTDDNGAGETTAHPLTRDQFRMYLNNVGGGLDHVLDRGLRANLDSIQRHVPGQPAPGVPLPTPRPGTAAVGAAPLRPPSSYTAADYRPGAPRGLLMPQNIASRRGYGIYTPSSMAMARSDVAAQRASDRLVREGKLPPEHPFGTAGFGTYAPTAETVNKNIVFPNQTAYSPDPNDTSPAAQAARLYPAASQWKQRVSAAQTIDAAEKKAAAAQALAETKGASALDVANARAAATLGAATINSNVRRLNNLDTNGQRQYQTDARMAITDARLQQAVDREMGLDWRQSATQTMINLRNKITNNPSYEPNDDEKAVMVQLADIARKSMPSLTAPTVARPTAPTPATTTTPAAPIAAPARAPAVAGTLSGAGAVTAPAAAPTTGQPLRKTINGVTYEQDPTTGVVRKVQ